MFRPIKTAMIAIALTLVPVLSFAQNAPTSRPAPALKSEAPDVPIEKVAAGGRPDTGFMRLHNQYVADAKKGNIDLYMLGDSITDFWQHNHKANWDRNLGGFKAGDFGISGDRTEHVLWRIENGELDGVTPKAIVLLIGTNNLPANTVYTANTVEGTFKGVKAIVDKLKEKQPQAHILLLAVFPRADTRYGDQTLKVNALNKLLPQLDDGKQVKFMNINDKFADPDGKLIPGVLLSDNLHPSDRGYDLWASAIRPTLIEWLGEPSPSPKPPAN